MSIPVYSIPTEYDVAFCHLLCMVQLVENLNEALSVLHWLSWLIIYSICVYISRCWRFWISSTILARDRVPSFILKKWLSTISLLIWFVYSFLYALIMWWEVCIWWTCCWEALNLWSHNFLHFVSVHSLYTLLYLGPFHRYIFRLGFAISAYIYSRKLLFMEIGKTRRLHLFHFQHTLVRCPLCFPMGFKA